jgi:uncharacterized membrane protein YebE (DUF533 family)
MSAFSLDDLQLAFSLHIADLILGDEAARDPDEAAFFARTFPADRLLAAGFRDATGQPTDAYHEAAMAALDTLPSALHDKEKCALLQVFVAAVMADGEVEPGEARSLVDGGRLLEIGEGALRDLLQASFGLDLQDLAEDD